MRYLQSLFTVVTLVLTVSGQSVVPCNNGRTTPSSTTMEEPTLPTLPDQFQMNIEANIVQKNMTSNYKEYYDFPGDRGSLELYDRKSGEKYRTIMDFKNNEAWMVFNNKTCRFLPTNGTSYNFGYMSDNGHLKPVKDLLYFGDNMGEIYKGKNMVRGIPTDHWSACFKMPNFNGSFTMDYYFTESGYIVDGKSVQVPVRAVLNGSGTSHHTPNQIHTFYHIYDFFDFKAGPIDDEEVFQAAPGVVCDKGRPTVVKSPPTIPDQFSASMQRIELLSQGRFSRDIYELHIDSPSQLFRIDSYSPLHPDEKKLYGNKPLSYIYDYNNTMLYIIDKYGGNCSVQRGFAGDQTAGRPGLPGKQSFKIPIAVTDLFMDFTKFTYQGQKSLRNMPVESWGYFDATNQTYFDILFSIPQLGPGPMPQHVPPAVPMGISRWKPASPTSRPEMTFEHVFDFIAGHVDPDIFDVSSCYTMGYHSIYLAVDVTGEYILDVAQYNPKELLSKLRQMFAGIAKVSPTRISSIKWEVLKPSDKTIKPFLMVTFIILDNKLSGITDITLAGPSLSDATNNMMTALNSATNNIPFNVQLDAGKTMPLAIRAGSLWQLQPQYTTDSSLTNSSQKTYSPAAMAGLGIGMLIIGALLGLVAAYLIYKRIDTSVPYQVTT